MRKFLNTIMTSRYIFFYLAALGMMIFLVTQMLVYDRNSIQMDFSAYYTAGESLNKGLSPYENHFALTPPIWDGVSNHVTSRFLYPPLVANFFQLFALIPFSISKIIWSLLNLIALIVSLLLMAKMVIENQSKRELGSLLSIIGLGLFFPVYTYFERGQIDGITLFFLVVSIDGLRQQKYFKAGVFLALAMLIKINILMILPVFLLKKYRKVIIPLVVTFFILCAATLIFNKWEIVKNYVVVDLPRIVKYNEVGPEENRIDDKFLIEANEGFPLTEPHKQGIGYQKESFQFNGYASISRSTWGYAADQLIRQTEIPLAGLVLNLFFYLILLGFCLILLFRYQILQTSDAELLFWCLIFVSVLFLSPLTWTMNLVWLIILFPVMVRQVLEVNTPSTTTIQKMGLFFGALGLVFIALPDVWLNKVFAHSVQLWINKYVVGELLIIFWLIVTLIFKNKSARKNIQPDESVKINSL